MAAKAKKPKTRSRTGQIGNEIFEQVESMVASEKVSRSEAFRRISEKSGRKMGTVAANYYRVARQRGAKLRRRRRGPGRPPGVRRMGAAGQRAGARLVAALSELGALIREQGAELNRLRRENERFSEIRRLISRS